MAQAGTSLVTTEPAPMTAWSPIVTPSSTTTFEPIHTSSPTRMPRLVTGWRKTGRSGSVEWLKPSRDVCAPIRTASPSDTFPRTTAYGLTVQSEPMEMSSVT